MNAYRTQAERPDYSPKPKPASHQLRVESIVGIIIEELDGLAGVISDLRGKVTRGTFEESAVWSDVVEKLEEYLWAS